MVAADEVSYMDDRSLDRCGRPAGNGCARRNRHRGDRAARPVPRGQGRDRRDPMSRHRPPMERRGRERDQRARRGERAPELTPDPRHRDAGYRSAGHRSAGHRTAAPAARRSGGPARRHLDTVPDLRRAPVGTAAARPPRRTPQPRGVDRRHGKVGRPVRALQKRAIRAPRIVRHYFKAGQTRRRLLAVFILTALVFSVVIARVVMLQTADAESLREAGRAQRTSETVLRASRGVIFDRNGDELALSVPATTIIANPKLVGDPSATVAALATVLASDTREAAVAAGVVHAARQELRLRRPTGVRRSGGSRRGARSERDRRRRGGSPHDARRRGRQERDRSDRHRWHRHRPASRSSTTTC